MRAARNKRRIEFPLLQDFLNGAPLVTVQRVRRLAVKVSHFVVRTAPATSVSPNFLPNCPAIRHRRERV
jgi:hypothetical protein